MNFLSALVRQEKNPNLVPQSEKPLWPTTAEHRGRELKEPDNLALFYHSNQRQPHLLGLLPALFPGIRHQIIRSIKTIRNKYLKEIVI
jgi:hypothetical protein